MVLTRCLPMVVLSMLLACPAAAQLNSVPLLAPEIPDNSTPVKAYWMWSRGLNDESGKNTAWTLCVDAHLGMGLTVGAAVSRFNPQSLPAVRDWSWQGGVRAAFAVLHRDKGLREAAIQIMAGAGHSWTPDHHELFLPLALALSYQVDIVGFSSEFSAAPHIAARRTRIGASAVTQGSAGFGLAARLFIPAGIGVVASFDWSTFAEAANGIITLPAAQTCVIGFALRKGI